jgi:putative transposase
MNWPHAPAHWLFEPGLYMVTAGTHQKLPHLNMPERLDFFLDSLFARAGEFGWELRAWAVMANHYHFVAVSPPDPASLWKFLGKLHMQTAKQINLWDNTPGRKVWFQFWDSRITFLLGFLESVPAVSAKLKAPITADRKFEEVVKSAQNAAVLVLVY